MSSRKKTRTPIPEPNKVIQALSPYDPANTREKAISEDIPYPLKLDWNESTRAPAPSVTLAIENRLHTNHLNLYPDIETKRLRSALSGYTGLSMDHVLVTNGSDSALELIVRTFVEQGKTVGVPVPTYSHFVVFAKGAGLEIREILYNDPFEVDETALEHALNEGVSLLYLPSPSNPTGIVYGPQLVQRLALEYPDVIFLLDEAYFEFCGITSAPLVDEYPNVIVTRTFSKAFALAGMRVGYLLAHPEVVKTLSKLHNPKSVATINQAAAVGALDEVNYMKNYVAEVKKAREWTVRRLNQLGIEARSTHANYILFKVDRPREFAAALHELNCFVRDRSSMPGMEGWIRVTVGSMEEMREFVERAAAVQNSLYGVNRNASTRIFQ